MFDAMSAYVTSPDLDVILEFANDSVADVRDWLSPAISDGHTTVHTSADLYGNESVLIVNWGALTSAYVDHENPNDELAPSAIWQAQLEGIAKV